MQQIEKEPSRLLKALERGPVLCAEGYLFEMERRGYLKANAFVPEVVLDNPQAIEQLHRDYVNAGSDVVLAFTYYADREKMKSIGREIELETLYRNAMAIAKKVADDTDTLLAGNIGQSNVWKSGEKALEDKTKAMFEEQIRWSAEEGAEFIVAETISFLGEAVLALEAIKKTGLPAVVNLAIDTHGILRDGFTPEEACQTLSDLGADVVGLNCYQGPSTILNYIEKITKTVNGYVAALPVAYRTTEETQTFQVLKDRNGNFAFPVNLDPFTVTRDEMAQFVKQAVALGVRFIGGCCGTGPHHIRAMAEALGRTPPASKYSPLNLTDEQQQLFLQVTTIIQNENE